MAENDEIVIGTIAKPQEETAPETMYREVEQDENVPKGYIKITEIIAYDTVGKKKNEVGKEVPVERGRKPYFCQDREDVNIFKVNNPKARVETFDIQVLKSTAIKYLNDPENMHQFRNIGL